MQFFCQLALVVFASFFIEEALFKLIRWAMRPRRF